MSPTEIKAKRRMIADSVRLTYGSREDPRSAHAHLSPEMVRDAHLAAAARLLLAQDGAKYAPAIEFLNALLPPETP